MCGIDLRLQQQEKRALEREEKFAERKQRNVEALQTACKFFRHSIITNPD